MKRKRNIPEFTRANYNKRCIPTRMGSSLQGSDSRVEMEKIRTGTDEAHQRDGDISSLSCPADIPQNPPSKLNIVENRQRKYLATWGWLTTLVPDNRAR